MVSNNQLEHQAIMSHLIEIKENQGETNQHLKDLNGKVAANVLKIDKHDGRITKINAKVAYYAGAIATVIFVIQIVVAFIVR